MCEDTSIARQRKLSLLKAVIHGLSRVIHQRLPNEFVVMQLFLRDAAQCFDYSGAWVNVQLLERVAVVVFGRAQIWLARRQSLLHLDVQESVT